MLSVKMVVSTAGKEHYSLGKAIRKKNQNAYIGIKIIDIILSVVIKTAKTMEYYFQRSERNY